MCWLDNHSNRCIYITKQSPICLLNIITWTVLQIKWRLFWTFTLVFRKFFRGVQQRGEFARTPQRNHEWCLFLPRKGVEIISSRYLGRMTMKSDVWSLGLKIVLFETAMRPFLQLSTLVKESDWVNLYNPLDQVEYSFFVMITIFFLTSLLCYGYTKERSQCLQTYQW